MTVTSHSLVARRYAQALFELADGQALDGVAQDMAALRAMLAESADLRGLVKNPTVTKADRLKALESLSGKIELGDLAKRFVGVIVENDRLADLDTIASVFLHEVSRRRGQRDAEVTVAQPIDEARRAAIEAALNKALAAKTIMSIRVDPSILGGMIIRVGSQLIDASLKTKLDRLGRILKTAA